MSEEPAAPVGEDNPEVKPVDGANQQDQEISNKDTELMMVEDEPIEDEKMPSYMNTTSISSSTKYEDSRNDNDGVTQPQLDTRDPLRDDDDDEDNDDDDEGKNHESGNDRSNGSVVELSSGEESDRADEDEEDYSTDEMDYDEEEEKYLRGGEYPDDDEDADSDGDVEADQFERSSDEYVYHTAPLESPMKERSRSLQDLSSPNRRTAKFNNRRQFQVMPAHLEIAGKPSDFHLGGQRRASLAPIKYGYVESKVKQYIEGIKEQNRSSAQRRSKEKLDVNKELSNLIRRDQNMETDIRVNPQSRLLKGYTENNMKHIIVEDPTLTEDMMINRNLSENCAEIIAVDAGDSMKKSYGAMAMEVDKENEIHEDQSNRQCGTKPNGLLVNLQSNPETNREIERKDEEEMNRELTNGNDEMPHVSSFQSVSYEDFIKGHFNDNQKTEVSSKEETAKSVPDCHQDSDKQVEISAVSRPLKIQNVESLSEEIIVPGMKTVNPEVSLLKAQLNQTMAERDSIKEDYKMIVNDNFQLKREIEGLKKALANYEQEHKPKETKVASIQTELLPSVFDKSTVSHLKVPNKLSASSITSAQSSEHWTDSNCSPSVSLKPPNVGSILNSDDSIYLGSPNRKTHRPLSQAFYTSSRILQTLANITQGRSDPANPNTGVRRTNARGQLNEPLSPLVLGDINTRKRKASDCNEASNVVGKHQFKVPNLNNYDKRRKYNPNYETDGDRTTLDQSLASRDRSSYNDDIKLNDDLTATEEIKINDGIKCFVYKDDDDSKEKSFLLQAEETHKIDTNGIVRECGPFLLANLEVRMSEANGTINIWGKEINRDSTSEDIDEELEEDPPETNEYWPKTPSVRVKRNEFVCSTEKRFKPIVSNVGAKAKIPRQLNTILNRPGGPIDEPADRQFGSMPNLENHGVDNCGCNHKRIHSPVQKNIKIKNHSCCLHNNEIDDCDCEIVQHTCGHSSDCRAVSTSNPSNLHVKHTCTNHLQNEETCRYQASTHLVPDDECCYVRKRCRSVELPCNPRIENICTRSRIQSVDGNSLFAGDNVPLMHSDRSSEMGDNAKRRLSGKRVRGILRDFLKSCGDSCRHPQNKSVNAAVREINTNSAPDIRVTAPIQEPETSNCDKCGTSMADFQQQFEQLQADLEKIHSKSQTLYKMMNTLRHLDSK